MKYAVYDIMWNIALRLSQHSLNYLVQFTSNFSLITSTHYISNLYEKQTEESICIRLRFFTVDCKTTLRCFNVSVLFEFSSSSCYYISFEIRRRNTQIMCIFYVLKKMKCHVEVYVMNCRSQKWYTYFFRFNKTWQRIKHISSSMCRLTYTSYTSRNVWTESPKLKNLLNEDIEMGNVYIYKHKRTSIFHVSKKMYPDNPYKHHYILSTWNIRYEFKSSADKLHI